MSMRTKRLASYAIVVVFVLIGVLGSSLLTPTYVPAFRALFAGIGTFLAYKWSSALSVATTFLIVFCFTFVTPLAMLELVGQAQELSAISRLGLLDYFWLLIPSLATIILALWLKRVPRRLRELEE